ncbi:MAG: DNA-protecting protein DprA [Anaerolineae bacterium]|mgnify:CR=1 FL=1|jgi:DNA processing protein|nr:DNA-protecting protein DprA [Anaerolineae bacterium]MBT7070665.1 DNA-protecting protein DprA [Anaerolineae bacterium]MBT7326293.1 DNA-protecting protein DprA [Anaerolineae bacterium]
MKRYWIGINLVKGIGAVRLRALLDFFGDAKTAWEGSPADLRAAGLSKTLIERFLKARNDVDLDVLWDEIAAKNIRVMTWEDADYPARLREIAQPPPILYLRGDFIEEDAWAVAIVGTQRVTSYGRQVTEEIASFLAQNGVTVVSGLARGVDGIAHQAALNAGGRTFAVLGSGVDRIYPPEHRNLAEAIIGSGAVISDYAPGTPPESSNFPPRNRIISGLSMGTIVIEAGATSGALITANFAVDQGREVFAVPGNIFAPQSKGPNRLLQQGAHPLLKPRDILEILDLTRVTEQRAARKAIPSDMTEAQLLHTLTHEPLHVDEIRAKTGLAVEKVSSALVMMELKGMVRHVGGMNYVVTRETQADYDA